MKKLHARRQDRRNQIENVSPKPETQNSKP